MRIFDFLARFALLCPSRRGTELLVRLVSLVLPSCVIVRICDRHAEKPIGSVNDSEMLLIQDYRRNYRQQSIRSHGSRVIRAANIED